MLLLWQDVIHDPMDLRTMKGKCNKNEYDNKEEFLHDVELMRKNCETYNGLDAALSVYARMVEEDIRAMLVSDTYRQRIEESEAAVEQHQLLTRLDVCIGLLALQPDAKVFAKMPDWPEYVARVETPLGLDTLRERVEAKLYRTAGEFMWDVQQMWQNSILYNGKDSYYTQRAEGLITRAKEYLVKWYTPLQLEPTDTLVRRLKKDREAAGIGAIAGRSSAATMGTSTPALSYQPSSRTPKHVTGVTATPGPSTLMDSPARSPVLASPQLNVGGSGGADTAASPRMSPSSLAPESPAMLVTPQISAGETAAAGGRSALRTPALSSSVASPLLTLPSSSSSPSAATRLPRADLDPSPFSTAHLPSFAAFTASSSPAQSSTTAFLPSSSSPSLHSGGGSGGMGVDEHDVLSGFGDMDAMFGAADEVAVSGATDMELVGLGGLGPLVGLGEEDGMALDDLPPPVEDGGERKEGEDDVDIWN